jgi:hypothetical protein
MFLSFCNCKILRLWMIFVERAKIQMKLNVRFYLTESLLHQSIKDSLFLNLIFVSKLVEPTKIAIRYSDLILLSHTRGTIAQNPVRFLYNVGDSQKYDLCIDSTNLCSFQDMISLH